MEIVERNELWIPEPKEGILLIKQNISAAPVACAFKKNRKYKVSCLTNEWWLKLSARAISVTSEMGLLNKEL
jgi:hypothetical protein